MLGIEVVVYYKIATYYILLNIIMICLGYEVIVIIVEGSKDCGTLCFA